MMRCPLSERYNDTCHNEHCQTFSIGYVYGLLDARIGDIFYVGSTVKTPGTRYSEHMRASRLTNCREAWILSILASGSLPLFCSLGEYSTQCEQELKQIERGLADALQAMGHTALCDADTLLLHGRIAEHLDRVNEQARVMQWLGGIA